MTNAMHSPRPPTKMASRVAMLCNAKNIQGRDGPNFEPLATYMYVANTHNVLSYRVRNHTRVVPQRRMRRPIRPITRPLLAPPHSSQRGFRHWGSRNRRIILPLHYILPRQSLAFALLHLSLLNRLIVVPRLSPALPLPHFHRLSRLALL